ncbi:DUF2520 domain-containing protein [Humibacter sp. RRB41]|uniref:DUF2520 domain-containing protein n=1 Tax=Humibacter sp. RRB41 TaxID=2919946 RepID=UPI001FAB168B|nr:DUF2520 domain-containing protein [Humibacter sp. RRB41]
MAARSGRLGVGIVGAGRVGAVLGAALAGAGHALVGIATSSQQNRERAEALLPGVPVLSVPDVIERAELVLLAVPGSELPTLVNGLALTGAWQPGQLVVHTAPEFGVGVLTPALQRGAIPLALHPAMVFSGTSLDLARLAESYFAVTAPAPVLPIGQALVVEMGGEPVIVDERARAAYAEAVSTATTFSRSIVEQASGILAGLGIENPGAYLSSLVRSSVDEALRRAGAPTELDVLDVPGLLGGVGPLDGTGPGDGTGSLDAGGDIRGLDLDVDRFDTDDPEEPEER